MVKRMLIDATHREETRVVVLDGNKLDEFDFESSTKQQLKGNIYLAKVTRVEPSLQAAFVEYGGNRHGFLAFNEIHPDYYRIPIADRERLIAELTPEPEPRDEPASKAQRASFDGDHERSEEGESQGDEPSRGDSDGEASDGDGSGDEEATDRQVETLGGDEVSEAPPRRHRSSRSYKIQEVIARRQIMLVQVVKEERGTKGAALTTFLSLAGRYCVLMPNTPRGGGVSRKITSAVDRKRLKTMLDDFNLPEGMAVIVRTAGMERPKPEIKRDYEYLLRLWDEIRELTLKSSAPALIHEEGDLVKRAIRDLYQRDIHEVLVEGEEGYRTAKSFMKMIVPSHAKRVQPYRDPAIPLFQRFQVESQLDAIHSPTVQLRSGGYIVINPTEALVSIDVNSGRATRERHIEETAVKTNLEAADEVARQVRLRDLAGLIVIDFIDMEENRNNHAVERRVKEAMKNDRARIQIGKISAFGLLELSRQRLRPSLLETSSQRCPHCDGTGTVRSTESTALHVLRAIEEEGIRGKSAEIRVDVPTIVALYMLNQKREALIETEARYHLKVQIGNDDSLIPPAYKIERLRQRLPGEEGAPVALPLPRAGTIADDDEDIVDEIDTDSEDEDESTADGESVAAAEKNGGEAGEGGKRKRRRGRRRRRHGEEGGEHVASDQAAQPADGEADRDDEEGLAAAEADAEAGAELHPEGANGQGEPRDGEAGARRRRRRGKRGGRRHGRGPGSERDGLPPELGAEGGAASAPLNEPSSLIESFGTGDETMDGDEQAPRPRRRRPDSDEPAADPSPSRVAGEAAAAAAAAFAKSAEDSDRQPYHRRWAGQIEQPQVAGEAAARDETVSAPAQAELTYDVPRAAPSAASWEPPEAPPQQAVEIAHAEPAPQLAASRHEPEPPEAVPEAVNGTDEPAAPNPAIQITVVADPIEKPRRGWWGKLSGRG